MRKSTYTDMILLQISPSEWGESGQNIYQRFLNISINVEKGWLGKSHLFKRPFRTQTPFSWRTIQMLRNSNPFKIPSPPPGSPPPTFVIITRMHNFEIIFFRISPHLEWEAGGGQVSGRSMTVTVVCESLRTSNLMHNVAWTYNDLNYIVCGRIFLILFHNIPLRPDLFLPQY